MNKERTASQRITDEVTSWPGVTAGPGPRGEFAFTLGGWEIGHLHGNRTAHFEFPKAIWTDLIERGLVVPHPIARVGLAARGIHGEHDIRAVIGLMRLNYDRAVERQGVPAGAAG